MPAGVARRDLIFRKCLATSMGRPTGLEPATPRSTILCSNQLSYDRREEPVKFSICQGSVNPIAHGRFQNARMRFDDNSPFPLRDHSGPLI